MDRKLASLALLLCATGWAGAQNAAQITAFDHDANGWAVHGKAVHFVLRGTPGAKVEAALIGVPEAFFLRERAKGQYEATWAPDEGIVAPRAPVQATLRIGNQTVKALSTHPLAIDSLAPSVLDFAPADRETVKTTKPEISARIDDRGGSGTNPSTIKLQVDNQDLTAVTSLVDGRLTAVPPTDLAGGRHTIVLSLADQAGNQTEVRWTITTESTQVQIKDPKVDSQGWVAAGDVVKVSVNGPAKGAATFSLPGVQDDIPMREVQAGRYEGTWKAPADKPVTATNVPVLIKFLLGREQAAAQGDQVLSIDTEAPRVGGWHPAQGGSVNDSRPLFRASLSDGAGSGLNPQSVEWLIDDRPLDADQIRLSDGKFSWRPKQALGTGAHFARLRVKDVAGNEASQAWAFTVTQTNNPIRQVIYEGPALVQVGDAMDFYIEAGPRGQLSVNVAQQIQLNLPEVSTGVYQARHLLATNERFSAALVEVTFTDTGGKVWKAAGDQRLSTVEKPGAAPAPPTATQPAGLQAPQITSPAEGATVDSPVTITGRAQPGANVRLKIDYTARVLILNVNGTLLEQVVTADDQGNWKLADVKLDGGVTGRGTQFKLTAWTVGENDKLSAPATVEFRR